jgi:hypothetical protein
MIGQIISAIPQGFNRDDINVMKAFMEGLPSMAYLIVAAGWMIGSFFAGFAEQTISRSSGLILPIIVGGLLTAAAIWNFVMLPHPTWFVVFGLLIFIPFTLIGHKAAATSSGR